MRKIPSILILFTLIFSSLSLINPIGRAETSPIKVAVSIVPQEEWVKAVGGNRVEVQSLIPAGQSPHSYSPSTTDLTFVTGAVVWFQMGLIEFDIANNQALRDAGPGMQVVNLSAGLNLIPMTDNEHEHGALDPHTWLSPTRAIRMVTQIATTLSNIDPTNTAEYMANAAAYIAQLTVLNATITDLMANVSNKHMLIFHPSYGYFAHDYGLQIIPLEEDGQDPSSAHYAEILKIVKEEEVGAIFIQAEISSSLAEAFAKDAGVEVVRLYPLSQDYLVNMNSTAHLIAQKLDQPPGEAERIASFPIVGVFIAMGIGISIVLKRKEII
jgi:zinc transport system substrate-binding protein